MSEQSQVSVILAAPVLDNILQRMYPVFQADQGRFRVASIAANWNDLERNTKSIKADVVLIEGDITNSPQQLAQYLATIPGVAIVVLPQGWAQAEGTIRSVSKVREIFIGPHVNYAEISQKVYSAAITERALHANAAPMEQLYGGVGGLSAVDEGRLADDIARKVLGMGFLDLLLPPARTDLTEITIIPSGKLLVKKRARRAFKSCRTSIPTGTR